MATKKKSGPGVWCAHDAMVPLDELKPNPRNPNRHPEEQLRLLAHIIEAQGWRAPITVSNRSGLIVRGHGRLEAARLLELDEAPVDYQDYRNDEDEWADLIADNRIAELAETDYLALTEMLEELDTGAFDMELTGYSESALLDLVDASDLEPLDEEGYTKKAEGLHYEPTGEDVETRDLYDDKRYRKLVAAIDESGVGEDVKEFLRVAATRHIVFDYASIAEFFANADEEVQGLMRDSALVIIDIGDAIRAGLTRFNSELEGVRDADLDG